MNKKGFKDFLSILGSDFPQSLGHLPTGADVSRDNHAEVIGRGMRNDREALMGPRNRD